MKWTIVIGLIVALNAVGMLGLVPEGFGLAFSLIGNGLIFGLAFFWNPGGEKDDHV